MPAMVVSGREARVRGRFPVTQLEAVFSDEVK